MQFSESQNVFSRQARYRHLIAASHRLTWWLGKRYPQAVPLVFVTGYPKSGTTWVTQLVADALRLPYPQLSLLPIACRAVVHGHQTPDRRMSRGVYVVRDGRDVMVSLYFHMVRTIPAGNRPKLSKRQRRQFPGLQNKEDVAANMPAFIEAQLRRPSSTRGVNWNRHVLTYFSNPDPHFALVRYEELLRDATAELKQAVTRVAGSEPADDVVRGSVNRFSFEQLTGRKPGEEKRGEFLRCGRAGDWRRYFSPEAAEIFCDKCRDALYAAGYEMNDDWVRTATSSTCQAA